MRGNEETCSESCTEGLDVAAVDVTGICASED